MIHLHSMEMAARRLWRRPAIALVIILTLGGGIGLTASLFAIVNAALWRPLPVEDPQRLLWIETMASGIPDGSSPGLLFAWRDRARTVTSIAGIRAGNATIDDAQGIDRVAGAYVSAAYFETLGLAPTRGRAFGSALDVPGSEPVVMISHRLWQRRYHGDETIVGRPVTFNGKPRTIIGIMPAAIDEVVEDADWWAPLALSEAQRGNVGPNYLDVIGRLAAGATLESARAELAALTEAAGSKADDGSVRGVRLTRYADYVSGPHRTTLLLLFGAVVVLFVIACANAANLQLADGLSRRGEMAVRASLGATRTQLVTQMAFEALLIATCACALGLLAAEWLRDALVALLPADVPRLALARIDPRTVLVAATAGLVSAVVAGLVPAVSGTRVDVSETLRARGRTATYGHAGLRRGFVILQVALTMALTTAGALLLRSTYALQHAPRGYDADGILTAAFTLPSSAFPDASSETGAFDRILTSVATLPGVSRAAIATRVPLAGSGAGSDLVRLDQAFDGQTNRQVRIRLVSPNYFATMKIPLLDGQDFTSRDGREAPRVLVVNETLAKRLGDGRPLVGAAVKFAVDEFNEAGRTMPWTVVAIAGDTRDEGPRQAVAPEVFVPLAQAPSEVLGWMGGQALLAVQGSGDVNRLTPQLRASLAGAGLKIPLYDVRTMDQRLAGHFAPERVASRLLALLAVGGLLLSSLGLFAVVNHLVRRQRRELALRLALGATPGRMFRRVVREGLWMALGGVSLGLVGSLALTRAFRSLLFGVGTADPVTLVVAGTILGVVTMMATWLPARAVAALDPALVLRED